MSRLIELVMEPRHRKWNQNIFQTFGFSFQEILTGQHTVSYQVSPRKGFQGRWESGLLFPRSNFPLSVKAGEKSTSFFKRNLFKEALEEAQTRRAEG